MQIIWQSFKENLLLLFYILVVRSLPNLPRLKKLIKLLLILLQLSFSFLNIASEVIFLRLFLSFFETTVKMYVFHFGEIYVRPQFVIICQPQSRNITNKHLCKAIE